MLLRTQPSNTEFDFGSALLKGIKQEVADYGVQAFQGGIVGNPPFTISQFEHIQRLSQGLLVRGFLSQLVTLSIDKHREDALQIIEGWKLSISILSNTPQYESLVGLLTDVVNADPVLGEEFNAKNEALRRIVTIGLNQFKIMHPSYIIDIVDDVLSSTTLSDEIRHLDEDEFESYNNKLALEYIRLIEQNPNLAGSAEIAASVLVEIVLSARFAVDVARKISKGQQVNFLNKLVTEVSYASKDDDLI